MNSLRTDLFFHHMKTFPRNFHVRRGCIFMLVALITSVISIVHAADSQGQAFSTPEAAANALGAAANAMDRTALRALFGLATDDMVAVDQVQATNELREFSAAYNQTHQINKEADDRYVLEVGNTHWPFPIPLVKRNGQWFFDTDAGREELLNRRIGRNELDVLGVVRAYVGAQREYASRDRDDDSVLEYAQRLMSSPGTKDGLYWPQDMDDEVSPLGPLVADAQAEGYTIKSNEQDAESHAFHGYFFKILKQQGKHAPGGKYNYVINGNMIGGFALVAWPATHGESGVMTFIVNQQGRVYQKDLGSDTAKLAARMTTYDPDETWKLSPD
jgi:hypothetical protein